MRLVKVDATNQETPPWNIDRVPVDFGPAITEGAIRCERTEDSLLVTPLPQLGPFSVALRPGRLGLSEADEVQSVNAVNAEGEEIRRVDFEQTGDLLRFTTRRRRVRLSNRV